MSIRERGAALFKVACLVLATCVFSASALAEVAGGLQRARRFKEAAIGHLKKAQLPGADKAAVGRRAVAALKSALSLLEEYEEPRPGEVEQEIQDINSLVYWVRKMTPIAVSGLKLQPERPAGKSREQLAKDYFNRVRSYARRNPDRNFLIAVKYFEVAERFQGTKWSLLAQRFSLDYQRKLLGGGSPASPEPPGDASSGKSKADRAAMVEDLDEVLGDEGLPPKDKLEMAEGLLAALSDDPLEDEVASIIRILASHDPDERSQAVARHFRLYGDGRFAGALADLKDEAQEATAFAALVQTLRSNTSKGEKARDCRDFLAKYPTGSDRREVTHLEEALSATGNDQRIAAWASYLIAFSDGVLAEEARKVLGRSETVLIAHMKRALSKREESRTVELGRLYLDVFPKGPVAKEIGSLLTSVMGASPGPGRRKAIERHLRIYPQSPLAGVLKGMADESRKGAEKEALEKLVREFAADGSEDARLRSCERFLTDYPRGGRAKEVRALRAAFALGSTRARASAARRYLSEYPDGAFAGHLKDLEQKLAGMIEEEAYRAATAALSDDSKSYASKLSTCESYITDFPDGRHTEDVRTREQEIRTLIEEEAQALKPLQDSLSRVASPAEGVSLCDVFLRKYPGGANRFAVTERKRGFEERLAEAAEADAYEALRTELGVRSLSTVQRADACLRFVGEHGGGRHRGVVVETLRSLAPTPLPSHTASVQAAVFSADSKHLFTVDAQDGICDWRLPDLKLVARHRTRPALRARAAAFSPPHGRLLLGEKSGGLTVVDIFGGKVLGRYRLGPGPITAVCPVSNGTVVTASLGDSKLRSWQDGDWVQGAAFACPGGVSTGATDPRGGRVAIGGRDGRLLLFRSREREPEWSEEHAHKGRIHSVAFSPDGRYLASASGTDDAVCLWRVSSGERLWRVEVESYCLAFTGTDGLATEDSIHSVKDGRVVAELGGSGPIAASSDGRFVFTGSDEGEGTVWYLPALLAE